MPADLVDRLVAVGAITTLEDGRDDSRDEPVASTAQAPPTSRRSAGSS
ncbi:MAG TPA: hypothetical protein VHM48_12705 [Candidatus Limnocylindrales bacterium]|nr:hypothetical protein [Candidatus Limnocylindrales bacterium]